MRIQATIDNLLNAFARRRREGHTTALFTGAANTPNITIIAADQRHAHDLDDHHHGPTYITLAQLDKLTGTRGPIAIDHHALQTVLAAANHEIDRSTKRNSQLTNQLEEVRNEAYNANLRAERAKRERDAIAHDLDQARTLAGELIAAIRINALRGTFATATPEQIEDWLHYFIALLTPRHAHQDAPHATASTEEAPKATYGPPICHVCRRLPCACHLGPTRHKHPGWGPAEIEEI